MTRRSPPSSFGGSAISPRATACVWPSRLWHGAGSSTTTAAPGTSSDWRITPAVGVCIDSFHILSKGHDPTAIEQIPGEKIFYLQLADAPALTMDVLSWSRHHRLFPGEGSFDLPTFVGHVLRAGYAGPLSLEVFNDTFRQTDVLRTAQQAKRSLTWLEDQVAQLESPPVIDRR